MFLSKIKKLFSSKMTALFTMSAASVGTISCVYGPDPGCCDGYLPSSDGIYSENEMDAYQQMCLSVMDTKDEYNRQADCKLKMADRYVYSAEECCASIRSDIEVQFFNRMDFSDNIKYDYYFIYTMLGRDNYAFNPVYMPTNAYTFCLLNTDPYSNQCDVVKAVEFERNLKQCCGHDSNDLSCMRSFILNNNECTQTDTHICCDGLPEEDSDTYVSKAKCEDIYNRTNVCVETMLDACCRNVPDTSSSDGLTKQICKDIYTESSGTCVNDDEKYQQYLDSQH